MTPSDFLDEFLKDLKLQLDYDNHEWGDTWLKRPVKGQADRIFDRFKEYYADAKLAKSLIGEDATFVESLPWTKIVGLALIGWIRENHPELFPDH